MTRCPHCDESHQAGTDYCPRTGRPIVDVAMRMVGRTIAGKYRLIESIGQGGMGTIFEAEHALIGNRMAVKLLHEPFAASREPVQRLYREARATGAIGHPNIIQIFDVGETGEGTPFLVMELLKGESLGDHLEVNGPRPLGFVLDVGIQMLSALNAAHTAGIIHRDLKSDNVFLANSEEDEEVRIKLLDFGVSKFTTPDQEGLKLTQTGSVLGTPYYMSPEQASGMKDLDFRLDIYAAGVILYELLTGSVPHRATNYNALLMEIITNDVSSFAWQRPDIPPALESAILKAVSRDRRNRWPKALDFMGALVEIRDDLSSTQLTNPAHVVQASSGRVSRDAKTLDIGDAVLSDEPDTPFAIETPDARLAETIAQTRPRRKVLAWVGAAVGLLAGLIVVLFTSLEGEGASRGNADEVGKPAGESGTSEHRSDSESARGASSPGQASIRLVVRRTPEQTKVSVDGRSVPTEGIELESSSSPLTIVAEAEGFESEQMEIIPSEDMEIQVSLKPLPKRVESSSLDNDPARDRTKTTKPRSGRKVSGTKRVSKTRTKPVRAKNSRPQKSIDRPMDNPF